MCITSIQYAFIRAHEIVSLLLSEILSRLPPSQNISNLINLNLNTRGTFTLTYYAYTNR